MTTQSNVLNLPIIRLGFLLACATTLGTLGGCTGNTDGIFTSTSSTSSTGDSSSSVGGMGMGMGGTGGMGTGGMSASSGSNSSSSSSSGSGGKGGGGGSGGGVVRAPAGGEVIFTELMPNPDTVPDTAGEWFELRNVSKNLLELAGCHLKDLGVNGDDYPINVPSLTIAPGGVIVMAKSADPTQNGGIQGVAHAYAGGFSLSNTGDEAVLECAGALIDSVSYTDQWPFTDGESMQLRVSKLTAAENDIQDNWCAATMNYSPGELGTPGTTGNHCP